MSENSNFILECEDCGSFEKRIKKYKNRSAVCPKCGSYGDLVKRLVLLCDGCGVAQPSLIFTEESPSPLHLSPVIIKDAKYRFCSKCWDNRNEYADKISREPINLETEALEASEASEASQKSSKNKKLIIAIVAIILLGGLGIFFGGSSTTSSPRKLGIIKPRSWNACTATCASNREDCSLKGASYEVCKGGEKFCMKDCCVMFQASDPTAAAWCR